MMNGMLYRTPHYVERGCKDQILSGLFTREFELSDERALGKLNYPLLMGLIKKS